MLRLLETLSFSQLPERPPYGFVIYGNGAFDVVSGMWGHYPLLKAKYPGTTQENLGDALNDGCIAVRVGVNVDTVLGNLVVDDKVSLLATMTTPSSQARRTLKDLSSWYSLPTIVKKA